MQVIDNQNKIAEKTCFQRGRVLRGRASFAFLQETDWARPTE